MVRCVWSGGSVECDESEALAVVGQLVAQGIPWSDVSFVPLPGTGAPSPEDLDALDVVPSAAPVAPVDVPIATAPPGPVAPLDATWTVAGGQVSAEAAARAVADAEYLRSLGMACPPPVYAPGAALVGIGRENLTRSHADWAEQPTMIRAMAELAETIRAEDRQDVLLDREPVPMDADGQLRVWSVGGPGGAWIEPAALDDVAVACGLPRGSAPLLSHLRAEDRASVWSAYSAGGERRTEPRDPEPWVARTRVGPGGTRGIFAAVSPGYRAFDADQIADLVRVAMGQVPGGHACRAEVTYDPVEASIVIDGTWHVDHVSDFGAGDTFKAGFRLRSSDNGGGSIRVAPTATRNLCLNLIVLDHGSGTEERIVHRGDARAIADRLARAVVRVGRGMDRFLRRWGYATEHGTALAEGADLDVVIEAWSRHVAGISVPRDESARTPADALRARWTLPEAPSSWGVPRDEIASAIRRQWDVEPSILAGAPTIAGLLNSVTGLHRERLPILAVQHAEQHAGRLLRAMTATVSR
jgi:hypothetical protein